MPINSFLYPGAKVTPAYEVANSVRLNGNAYMHKTQSGGNRQIFTMSCWTKLTGGYGGNGGSLLSTDGLDDDSNFHFTVTSDKLQLHIYGADAFTTAPVLRDYAAWYHVVLAVDTTQSTSSNRMKLYVNNSQITLTEAGDYPAQNDNFGVNESGTVLGVGTHPAASSIADYALNSYLAEYCLIDGQQLTPSSFGEYDSDSPTIWKPKDVSGLTFGTNGFYLDFEDSSNLGNDANGGTDLTEVNLAATDQSTDTCTNNFATMNPLNVPTSNAPTFLEGNLETESATTSSQRWMGSSTIGVSQGKWYAEVKIKVVDSCLVGITPNASENARNEKAPGNYSGKDGVGILIGSGNKYVNGNGTTHGAATSADGIMMIALDLDNNNVYFGSGGQWADGSGSFNQSNPTSAISITASSSTDDGAYFFAVADGGGSAKAKVQWNFGSPPYSISSGNADANGYGNFEYAVPSGYYSINTKNLAEFG